MRIKSKDLQIFADSHDGSESHVSHVPFHPLYSTETTVTTRNLEDLTIEKEYLYWTNSATSGQKGSLHKAFTEPFGRAVPLQTFENYEIGKAQSVATNSKYLFFTGYRSESRDMELFIQNKRSAGYYTSYSSAHTDHLKSPGAVLPYKDTLLLVANKGFISQLDLRNDPPTERDFFHNDLISFEGNTTPVSMTFMSDLRSNFESFSNTVSGLALTQASIILLAMSLF